MTGAFLIGFAILTILFFIIMRIDDYNEEGWGIASVVCFIITLILVISIPISRINTKADAEYAKIFQETLDYNRSSEQEFNVFERTAIIEEVNSCNSHINNWRIKGQKWYNNKWYLHPDTQKAKLIK